LRRPLKIYDAPPGLLDRAAQYGYETHVAAVYDTIDDVIDAFDRRAATEATTSTN
jgi:hypothetical protein